MVRYGDGAVFASGWCTFLRNLHHGGGRQGRRGFSSRLPANASSSRQQTTVQARNGVTKAALEDLPNINRLKTLRRIVRGIFRRGSCLFLTFVLWKIGRAHV